MGGSVGNTPTVAATEALGLESRNVSNSEKGDAHKGLANTLLLAGKLHRVRYSVK
jgi:hypothetical protein